MRRNGERGCFKLKLPFVPYITSTLSQRVIIIEKNGGRCTGRSALGEGQVVLSGTRVSSQHWNECTLHNRVFSLWFPGHPRAEVWVGEVCVASALPVCPSPGHWWGYREGQLPAWASWPCCRLFPISPPIQTRPISRVSSLQGFAYPTLEN